MEDWVRYGRICEGIEVEVEKEDARSMGLGAWGNIENCELGIADFGLLIEDF
ncbi:hypothetical protein ES706_06316 [subsurface metagenome]|nr:hypothetical protein [Bacteroidota bacterium]